MFRTIPSLRRFCYLPLLLWATGFPLLVSGCESSPIEATAEAAAASPSASPPFASSAAPINPRPLTRLFFQDHSNQTLRWCDVQWDQNQQVTIGPVQNLDGFPALDAAKQRIAQMKTRDQRILVGVRDNEDGKFQSGWTLIDSGVRLQDHGDHHHWSFQRQPFVRTSRLDKTQGNPAHLYLYDGRFFLANDKLNGYTRFDVEDFAGSAGDKVADNATRFVSGGGNHITLAVVDDRVGYSCWIDGGGPNKGRVDVTRIAEGKSAEAAYSFSLPSGGIHGAIAHEGRVFFAPSDGICWVDADLDASRKPDDVKVHHISLGRHADRPRRTGAFSSYGRFVIFNTGKDADAKLALLDAAAESPTPHFVSLGAREGDHVTSPVIIPGANGDPLAFAFHDHAAGSKAQDRLSIISLDPNGDGDLTDARPLTSLAVGPSAVEGHYGHHAIAFDADRRFGFFTNPGDGTLSVLSLDSMTIVQSVPVGGKPSAILACGGHETDD